MASPETAVPAPETTVPASETTVPSPEPTAEITTEAVTEPAPEPAPEPPKPELDPTVAGTLLYYEDFESYGTTGTNDATMSALGWTILGKADGAYADNSASYAIVTHGGSRQLGITNYTDTLTGNDSYVEILDEKVFRYLNTKNYTYQYDIEYTSAANTTRYFTLVSSYAGSFYNSFHLRNGGGFNNECHSASAWKKYASSGDAKSLLGLSASLNGVSISIRYVVDWENGCKIYARVNGDTASEWVLLSEFDAKQNGASYFSPDMGGSGFVLKVGGAQNGYIDNIMLWSGTVDAPTDTAAEPYLTSDSECHRMIAAEGGELCAFCGRTQEMIENAWLLSGIPAYEGGIPSRDVYLSGQGLDPEQPRGKEDVMQIIAETDAEAFQAYLRKLEHAGYVREFYREADGNLFASYIKGAQRVYTYFTEAFGETRVIAEDTSVSVSVSAFDYTYEKVAGDTTVIYQYALPLRDATHLKSNNYVDRGMLYVVKLADDKVVIFDGGESVQFTDAQVDNLMAFLREITGVGENGHVTIAAWYLTHAHQDHVQGFCFLARKYSAYLTLERVFYNIPSTHSTNSTVQSVNTGITLKLLKYIDTYFADDNVQFLKVHTGQVIQLADVTFEILYTHEDLVDPDTAETELVDNYNEASSVVKITIDGKSVLITGDIDKKAATILMAQWEADTLDVDILQLAHHVLNTLTDLYHLIKAPILFVPQSEDRINEHGTAPGTFASAELYAEEGMIFFQNEKTVGLAVSGGEFVVVYTRDIVYESQAYTWPNPN